MFLIHVVQKNFPGQDIYWCKTFEINTNSCPKPGTVSIQQKFWCEILEIPCAQWNGTFWLHRSDASHHAFGYCSCKQDAKELYWTQQFSQMEKDISARPTGMIEQIKVVPLQSWSQILWSDWTKMVHYINLVSNQNFQNLGLNGKCPSGSHMLPTYLSQSHWCCPRVWFKSLEH